MFVHISAVERAGLRELNEGQKVAYEIVADKRTGRSSAGNLKGRLISPILMRWILSPGDRAGAFLFMSGRPEGGGNG